MCFTERGDCRVGVHYISLILINASLELCSVYINQEAVYVGGQSFCQKTKMGRGLKEGSGLGAGGGFFTTRLLERGY